MMVRAVEPEGGSRGRKLRVLLAEDQTMMLEAVALILELEGDIEVVGRAADGLEALELLTRTQPDVLVTDIEMPGLGGLELAERVQALLPACRTVILTTFSRSGYLRRAL